MYITGKKARNFVNQYDNVLFPLTPNDVYKSCSTAKQQAWDYCVRKCEEMNGRRLTLLSHNSQTFTAAFEYTHPDTGVFMLHVETYANSYDMKM